jgi:uncharacterized cupredoxin-like copper-binding protein
MSCGGDSGTTATKTSAEASAPREDVTLVDFSMTDSPQSAKAGEIRFYAKNTGKSLHELVVVKSDANPGDLPVYGANDTPAEGHVVGDVDEDKITSEGEVEDIEPGSAKDATFVLAPGHYLLICNLPTHYGLGMRTALTVS